MLCSVGFYPYEWLWNPSVPRRFLGALQPGPLAFCPEQLLPSVPWLLGLGLSTGGQGRNARSAVEDTVLFKCLYDTLYSLSKYLFLRNAKWGALQIESEISQNHLPLGDSGLCISFLFSPDLQHASILFVTGPCCSPGWTGRYVPPVWRRTGNNSVICGCHLQAHGSRGDWAIH